MKKKLKILNTIIDIVIGLRLIKKSRLKNCNNINGIDQTIKKTKSGLERSIFIINDYHLKGIVSF